MQLFLTPSLVISICCTLCGLKKKKLKKREPTGTGEASGDSAPKGASTTLLMGALGEVTSLGPGVTAKLMALPWAV